MYKLLTFYYFSGAFVGDKIWMSDKFMRFLKVMMNLKKVPMMKVNWPKLLRWYKRIRESESEYECITDSETKGKTITAAAELTQETESKVKRKIPSTKQTNIKNYFLLNTFFLSKFFHEVIFEHVSFQIKIYATQ